MPSFSCYLWAKSFWQGSLNQLHVMSSNPFRACTCVHNCPACGESVPQWYFINSPTTSNISVSLTLSRHTWIVRSGYQLLPKQSEGFLQWSGAWNLPLYPSASEFLISMAEIQHLGWTVIGLPGKRHRVQPTLYSTLHKSLFYLFICFLPWNTFFALLGVQ